MLITLVYAERLGLTREEICLKINQITYESCHCKSIVLAVTLVFSVNRYIYSHISWSHSIHKLWRCPCPFRIMPIHTFVSIYYLQCIYFCIGITFTGSDATIVGSGDQSCQILCSLFPLLVYLFYIHFLCLPYSHLPCRALRECDGWTEASQSSHWQKNDIWSSLGLRW